MELWSRLSRSSFVVLGEIPRLVLALGYISLCIFFCEPLELSLQETVSEMYCMESPRHLPRRIVRFRICGLPAFVPPNALLMSRSLFSR